MNSSEKQSLLSILSPSAYDDDDGAAVGRMITDGQNGTRRPAGSLSFTVLRYMEPPMCEEIIYNVMEDDIHGDNILALKTALATLTSIPVHQIQLMYDDAVVDDEWQLADIPTSVPGVVTLPIIMSVKAKEVEFQATRKYLRQIRKAQQEGERVDQKLEEFQRMRLSLLQDMAARATALDAKQRKMDAELEIMDKKSRALPGDGENISNLRRSSVFDIEKEAERREATENIEPTISDETREERNRLEALRLERESQMIRIDLRRARLRGRIKKMEEELVTVADLRVELEVLEKEYVRAARVLEADTGQFSIKPKEEKKIVEKSDENSDIKRLSLFIEDDVDANVDKAVLMKRVIIELVIYILFLAIFTTSIFLSRGGNGVNYMAMTGLDNYISATPFNGLQIINTPPDLSSFSTVHDFWSWLEGGVIEVVYASLLTNLQPLSVENLDFVGGRYDKLLGPLRLRQVRVTPEPCVASNFVGKDAQCYPSFSLTSQSQAAYGPASQYTWSAGTSNFCEVQGELGIIYPPSGFIEYLPIDANVADQRIKFLKDNNWIDESTRAVFFELNTYNGNVDISIDYKILFEFSPSGSVIPTRWAMAFRLFRYYTVEDWVTVALELFICCFILKFIIDLILLIVKVRSIIKVIRQYPFAVMDFFNICTFVVVIGIRVKEAMLAQALKPVFKPGSTQWIDLDDAAYWLNQETTINAVNCILVYVRAFKYLRAIGGIQEHFDAYSMASGDIAIYTIIICIGFVAFASAGFSAFSVKSMSFRSFGDSFATLFLINMGQFDFAAFRDNYDVFGPLFIIMFVISMVWLLINMYVSILVFYHARIGEMAMTAQKYLQFPPFQLNLASRMVNLSVMADGGREECVRFSETIRTFDLNRDGYFTEDELSIALDQFSRMKTFFNVQNAKQLIRRFDIDMNGVLDRHEMSCMERYIKERVTLYDEFILKLKSKKREQKIDILNSEERIGGVGL